VSFKSLENFSVKDHSISKEKFELQYDKQFDLWQTLPKPFVENIGSYYVSQDYISHTDSKNSLTDKAYHLVKKWMFDYKFKVIDKYKSGETILDIGAGTGDFLAEAKKRNWKVTGVEPNNDARALAENKGIPLDSNLIDIDSNFDVITLWHVLEHVYDLDQYIRFLKNHLSSNGVLLIAVPNFKSWDAKKYEEFWAANDVPRHLYHFSKNSIERLFEKVEMKLIETKPLLFDSFYVSILSERYREKKFPFIRGLISGLQSNLSALTTNEYSSQIYVLKHKNSL